MSRYRSYFDKNKINFIRGHAGMEGSIPSVLKTKEALELVSNPSDDKEVLIIRNISMAWLYLWGNVDRRFTRKGCLGFYKKLQNILSNGVEDFPQEIPYRGKFRDKHIPVVVGDYTPPYFETSEDAESLFWKLFSEVDGTVDSILRFYLHCMKAQFFANTNKRSAYMLCNFLLIKYDLGCLLELPISKEGNKEFLRRVGYYYQHQRQETRLVTYLKKYYLRSVV